MSINKRIQAARGQKKVDLLLSNTRMVDVFSGDIVQRDIAIADGFIVGFGGYAAETKVDIGGRFVAPGFIDAHVHIESSMACIAEYARTVLARGTTTIVADPHEIANVLGTAGLNYMLRSAENQPLNIYFSLPSCVPASNLGTSGAHLSAYDLLPFMSHRRILALAEMMNFPGVLNQDPDVLLKIENVKALGKPIDGHAPGLSGLDLYAYIAAGISSDHECTTAVEAREKLAAGMYIMIREGSAAKNLTDLLPVVNAHTARRMMWCSDDRNPRDLIEDGHIDALVRQAIRSGLDPVIAVQMATLNPAEHFGLRDVGAIAPGRRADLVVFSDLNSPCAEAVYSGGLLKVENGQILPHVVVPPAIPCPPSMHVDFDGIDFAVPAQGRRIRIIENVPDQVLTRQQIEDAPVSGNLIVSDPARDILKLAVIERHRGFGYVGKAFVRGFGLKHGALASSVAHDSHNIIVVGVSDEDMKAAVKQVIKMGGGLAAACQSEIRAALPLPIAGLMSEAPIQTVKNQSDKMIAVARDLGSLLHDPFMTLSFLSLPVIPELKLTDKGLVDVIQFKFVSLFVD